MMANAFGLVMRYSQSAARVDLSLRDSQADLSIGQEVALSSDFIVNSDGEMELRSVHPGATLDEVKSTIGWEIRTPANVPETPSPTAEELRLIREELDPTGAYV
jgi:glutaconate CoA-transferase subunit B